MRRIALFAAALALAALACNKESAAAPAPNAAVAANPAAPAAPAVPNAAPAAGEQAPSEAAAPAGDKQYRFEAGEVRVKAGATATAKVVIKPAAGLHFNAEYPAKFTVTAGRHAKGTKDKFSMKDGDVKVEGLDGVVTLALQGLAAGAGPIEVVGSFSVCSSEQCYMLRDEKLQLQVAVQ